MHNLFPLCLLSLLAACGGAANGGETADQTDGGGPAADAATSGETGDTAADAFLDWREEASHASCERKQRCESPAPYDSVEVCLAEIADSEVATAAPRIAESIRGGRTHFFSSWAEDCLAIYEDSCDLSLIDIAMVCNNVYDGQQQVDDPCVGHFECANPPGDERLLCFDDCDSLWGTEETAGGGLCVAESPVGSPACE